MIVTGMPGTGKNTVTKSMCARENIIYLNINVVQRTTLCIGTTCTTDFVIGSVTCHFFCFLQLIDHLLLFLASNFLN